MIKTDYRPFMEAEILDLPDPLRSTSMSPFVGRAAELEKLRTLMPRAEGERRRVVLLAGPRSATQAGIRRILNVHGLTAIQCEACSGGRVFTARMAFSKASYHA